VSKIRGLCEKGKLVLDALQLSRLSFILACKLKAFKIDLKTWNEEVFANVLKQKKVLLDELRVLDVIVEEDPYLMLRG
jgi:hypothetical protein